MSSWAVTLRVVAVPLLSLLLLSHPSLADYPGVTVSSVSGCTNVGTATDNCVHGQAITVHGSGFLLIPNITVDPPGVAVGVIPDTQLTLKQASSDFNVTNTTIVAQLLVPPQSTLDTGTWENITVGAGFNVLGVTAFGPAFRYAAQQPPSITKALCSTAGGPQSGLCNSQSTLIVTGSYFANVTGVQVTLTLSDGELVFSVPCSNITLVAQPTSPQSTIFYTLYCQLPQLSYGQSAEYSQNVRVQLISPYGVETAPTANVLYFNTSGSSSSAASSAPRSDPTTYIALAGLSLIMALLSV